MLGSEQLEEKATSINQSFIMSFLLVAGATVLWLAWFQEIYITMNFLGSFRLLKHARYSAIGRLYQEYQVCKGQSVLSARHSWSFGLSKDSSALMVVPMGAPGAQLAWGHSLFFFFSFF